MCQLLLTLNVALAKYHAKKTFSSKKKLEKLFCPSHSSKYAFFVISRCCFAGKYNDTKCMYRAIVQIKLNLLSGDVLPYCRCGPLFCKRNNRFFEMDYSRINYYSRIGSIERTLGCLRQHYAHFEGSLIGNKPAKSECKNVNNSGTFLNLEHTSNIFFRNRNC